MPYTPEQQKRRQRERKELDARGPSVAKRCECDRPFVYEDDGEVRCLVCGKRP